MRQPTHGTFEIALDEEIPGQIPLDHAQSHENFLNIPDDCQVVDMFEESDIISPIPDTLETRGFIMPHSYTQEQTPFEPTVPATDFQALMDPQPTSERRSPSGASLGRPLLPRTDPSQPGPSSLHPDPPQKPRKKRISEDGQYQCPEPSCGNRYVRENDLKNHIRHHQYKYSCEICRLPFTFNKDLQRHVDCSGEHSKNSGVKQEKFWTCPVKSCKKHGQKSYRKDNFKRHCQKLHPDIPLKNFSL